MTKRITGESLHLVNLTKKYDSIYAVRNLSLDIEAGEFVSLLGPSGSGKTTTLMMIAGFEIPLSGDIRLGPQTITDLAPHQRNMGVVFQNYALFPHLSVFENIAFPLKMRNMSSLEIARLVDSTLELVRMPGYGARQPHQLSGGQQQRIALARALVFRPSIVLMDEPLGALDKQLREHMQLEIKQLQQELGITVIYVTHDQSEALTMSDRIVVMNDARIEQVGTPEDIYEKPLTRFTASFIGESTFLTGDLLEAEKDGTVALVIGGRTIRACYAPGTTPANPSTALVRPEKIKLATASDMGGGDNLLQGRIVEVVYLGSHRRYRVEVNGLEKIFVSAAVSSHSNQQVFRRGDEVCLIWSVSDTRLLANDSPHAPLQR